MGKRGNRQRTGGGGGKTDTRAGFRAPTAGHEDVKFVFGKPTSTADCEDAMTTLCRYLATMTVPGMTEYATHLEARKEPTFEDPPEPSRKEATVNEDGTKGGAAGLGTQDGGTRRLGIDSVLAEPLPKDPINRPCMRRFFY